MTLQFSKINNSNKTTPSQSYSGQEDQSYGFTPPYKIQTGDSRGELTIKGLIRVVDTAGTVRLIMGFKPASF